MDWNLQRFSLFTGSPQPTIAAAGEGIAGALEEAQAMQATAQNGSAEYTKISLTPDPEAVSDDAYRWSKWATLALVLDLVTLACIAWLVTR